MAQPPADLISPPDDLVAAGPPPDLISPPDDLVDAPGAAQPSKPGGFFRGVKEGFTAGLTGTPEAFGAGVEAYGRAAGIPGVTAAGEAISEATKTEPPEMVPLRDALSAPGTFIGQQLGRGVGSTVPTLVSGAAGATAGGMLAGPGGAVLGGLLGSAAPSLPINTGDLYQQLVAEGVDKDRAAALAAPWGVVLTAPDVFSASRLLKPFLGTVSEAGSKGLAKLLAQRIKEGAAVEGLTEMGQQGLQETIAAAETGDTKLADRAERVAEAGISGTLGGGTIGGAGAVVERVRGQGATAAPPDDLVDVPGEAPAPGAVVGVKTADGVERGVVERVDDGVVYWRDESNAERVDDLADFQRDLAEAPAPRSENATTVGEPPPDLVEPPFDIVDASLEPVIEPDVEPRRRPGDEVAELRGAERSIAMDKRIKRERAKMERGDADALTEDEIISLENRGRAETYDPGPQPRGDEAGIVARQGELALEPVPKNAVTPDIDAVDPERAAIQNEPLLSEQTAFTQPGGDAVVADSELPADGPERQAAPQEFGRHIDIPPNLTEVGNGGFNSPSGESAPDVSVWHAKLLGDLRDAQSVPGESYSVADPRYRRMLEAVLSAAQNREVFGRIVGAIPVDVMNNLAGQEVSAESLRSDGAMFVDALSAKSGLPVGRDAVLAAVRGAAGPIAEHFGIDTTGRPREGGAAVKAREGEGQVQSPDVQEALSHTTKSDATLDTQTDDPLAIPDFLKRTDKLTSGADPTDLGRLFKPLPPKDDKAPKKYEIVDRQTGEVVGEADTLRGARRSVDKRDNAYGGYRYTSRINKEWQEFYEAGMVREHPSEIAYREWANKAMGRDSKLTSGADPTEAYNLLRSALSAVGRAWQSRNLARTAAESTRIPVGSPDSLQRLSAFGRYFSFATGLASRDKPSGRLFSAYLDRDRTREMFERAAIPAVKPYMDLPPQSQDRVNRVLEHDRMNGVDRRDNGRKIVVQVSKTSKPLDLSKPGDVIRLSAEETAALHAVRKFTDQRLLDLGAAMAREQGYTGEFTEAALKNPSGKEAERAAQILDAVTAARRSGYIPFNRYGDYFIKIIPKPQEVPGKDAMPPSLEDGRFEFVDTGKPWSALLSERAGSSPQAVSDRVKELEAKYPRSRYDYEVGRVTPKQIQSLDIPLIEKLFAAVNMRDPEVGQKLYDDILQQVYKDRLAGFRKQARNIPGYSTDFERSIADYVRQSSSVIANMDHGKEIEDAYSAIQVHPDRNVRDFWQAHRRHIESQKSDFASLRKFGFFNFLWGSPSSALINLTQTPLVTGFQLGSWAGTGRGQQLANGALYEALNAIRPTSARGFTIDFDKIGRTPAEKAMLRQLLSEGVLDPVVANELQGADVSKNRSLRPVMRAVNRVYEIGASMFNVAEQANRAAAALAYFRAAQSPDLRKKLAAVYAEDQMFKRQVGREMNPVDIARWGIDETQFIGGKLNRQPIQRGVGSLALQFQQYNANYMRLLYKNFTRMGHEGKVAGSLMLISLIAAGGLLGFPFADDILGMAQYAYKTATGIDPLIERRFAQFVADDLGFGSYGAEIALRGPSRLAGVDLSKRIGMGDVVPKNDLMDVAGPVASATFGRAQEVWQRYSTGQPIAASVTALQSLIGKGPSDVLRGAVQLPAEGYSTLRGAPVVLPSDVTGDEQAARMLGFQPSRFARRSEADYEDRRLAEATKEASTKLLTRVAREFTLAEDARRRGDQAEARRYEQRGEELIQENADQLADDSIPEWSKIPAPTAKSIKDRVRRYLEPVEARMKSAPKLKREEMQRGPWVRE